MKIVLGLSYKQVQVAGLACWKRYGPMANAKERSGGSDEPHSASRDG